MSEPLEDRINALEARIDKLNRNLMLLGCAVIMTGITAILGIVN